MKIATLLLAGAVLAGSAGLVLAQPAGGAMAGPGGAMSGPGGAMSGPRGPMMAACKDDMAKFCADKTGPDRRQCMTANNDKLSAGCKSAMASMRPAGQ